MMGMAMFGSLTTGVKTDGQGLVILAKSCHRLSTSRQVGSQLELILEFSIPKTENNVPPNTPMSSNTVRTLQCKHCLGRDNTLMF